MGCMIDITRCTARAHANGPLRRINANASQQRQVDDKAVINAGESRSIMSTAADCNREIAIAPKIHCSNHVCNVGAPCNQSWSLVDHGIVKFARLLVGRVFLSDQIAAETLREPADAVDIHCDLPEASQRITVS